MGLIKEPKHVDFLTSSEPWTEQELADFRILMQNIRERNRRRTTKMPVVKTESRETI